MATFPGRVWVGQLGRRVDFYDGNEEKYNYSVPTMFPSSQAK